MNVYLINNIDNTILAALLNVNCVWDKEIHFNKQEDAKKLIKALDEVITKQNKETSKQIIYASDIANSIVIAQKNITIIASSEVIDILLIKAQYII